MLAGLAVLGAVIWMIVTGLMARSELDDARADLNGLRQALMQGDFARAEHLAAELRAHADRAHSLTTGPAWAPTAALPWVGSPAVATRTISAQIDRIAERGLPGVIQLADQLRAATHSGGSRIDLAALNRATPTVERAAKAVHAATRAVRASPGSWLPPLASARSSLVRQLTNLDGQLSGAAHAIRILVPMLGLDRPQRYFVGFLNEAESRGVGGVPGSFAIAVADKGHVDFTQFGSDDDMRHLPVNPDLGAQFSARYRGADPRADFRDSDVSPDFANAGRIWAAMWEKKTGQPIDGALALDPTALRYLLAVIGPVTLADGEKVSAKQVVALTEQSQYARFPSGNAADKQRRKAYLIDLAQAISGRVAQDTRATALVRAVSRAAKQRRLTVWSADPGVERNLVDAAWAGELNPSGGPFSGFVVNNGSGTKLDYYVQRHQTYTRRSCAAGPAVATLTLHSAAPTSGLPSYVTDRIDPPPAAAAAGDERLILTYYASPGSRITALELDGHAQLIAPLPEENLPSVVLPVELQAGSTHVIRVRIDEPAAHRQLTVLRQPLVTPLTVTTRTPHCS